MGRYEKYVDREVANAKPYRFRDSAFNTFQTNMDVSSSRNHNKSGQMQKKYKIKAYNFLCKISSRYFSKMLSIPRYRAYRPIPSDIVQI